MTEATEVGTLCPVCTTGIRLGEPITRPALFDPWRHVRCPRTKFDFDPADVCPDCFTVRTPTGACSCP